MKRLLTIAVAIIIVATVVAGIIALTGIDGSIAVDSSYSGEVVELGIGKTLTVTLDSNPTTGFSWALVGISDDSVLEQTGQEFKPPETEALGAGGEEVWIFQTLAEGTGTISMEYSRPWEENASPAETFALTVIVN